MNQNKIKRKIKKDLKYYDKHPENLKQEFIEQFGKELWDQQESLAKLYPIEEHLSNLFKIEMIPVVSEDIEEDSRYMIKENYIIISNKIIHDQLQATKALIHEYTHYYQYCVVENNIPHPFLEYWKENIENPYIPKDPNNTKQMVRYYLQPIELDAFAFTKYYFKKYLNLEINQLHPDFEKIIDLYITKYYTKKETNNEIKK